MFSGSKIESLRVKISISREVLEGIFDECDRYDREETGGRLVGFYKKEGEFLRIEVRGLIGPGPNARRSPTSFYQDGDYQERIFRKIEAENPSVEHLGNWHTHHVNGLDTLSSGDIATYQRTVNHASHNTDFFFAILVVAQNKSGHNGDRYRVKHFLFLRGKPGVYEIPGSQVSVIKEPALFVDGKRIERKDTIPDTMTTDSSRANEVRSRDREIIPVMFPGLKPYFSRKTESIYWKGKLSLIDDTSVEVLMLESVVKDKPTYSVTVAGSETDRFRAKKAYLERAFDMGWKAIYQFERDLNREVFNNLIEARHTNPEGD